MISTGLVGAGFALALVALWTPWWGETATGTGTSVTFNFLAGTQLMAVCTSGCDGVTSLTAAYSSFNLNNVGALYTAILGALIVAIVLAAACAAFVALGAFGYPMRSRHFRWVGALGVPSAFVLVGLAIGTSISQPTLLGRDTGSTLNECLSGVANPCSSFWGSASNNGASITWGAGVGWYAALGACVVLLAGTILYLSTRSVPFRTTPSDPEPGSVSAPVGTGSPGPVSAKPVASSDPRSSAGYCSRCGATFEEASDMNCSRCGAARG